MNLTQWAIKWGVPFQALEDLRRDFQTVNTDPKPQDGDSEAAVQASVRLEASRKGCRLWRNNVGATYTEDGSFIRYGLANDSKKMNAVIKSSDLIGIRPVVIGPSHIGCTIGQFIAREVKPEGWKYTETKREAAQFEFLKLVAAFGGDASFVSSEGTI